MMKNLELTLQLFAEAAGSDTAQFTGVTEAAAAPQATGENAASDAGMQDLSEEFAQLIKGKYKDAYNRRVQETLQKRLRGNKKMTEKMEALTPVVEKLQSRLGVEAGDISGLSKAVESLPTQPSRQQKALQQQSLWVQQAAQTKSTYPGFNMGKELQNPAFLRLLRNDVPVQTAYEVLHRDQLLPAAMAHTAFTVEQKLANHLAAMGSRPGESALGSGSAAVVKNDVSQMSRQDRADIIRRVRKGEKIRF